MHSKCILSVVITILRSSSNYFGRQLSTNIKNQKICLKNVFLCLRVIKLTLEVYLSILHAVFMCRFVNKEVCSDKGRNSLDWIHPFSFYIRRIFPFEISCSCQLRPNYYKFSNIFSPTLRYLLWGLSLKSHIGYLFCSLRKIGSSYKELLLPLGLYRWIYTEE